MNDTSLDMEQLWRSRILARAPEERLIMGLSMYETARKIVLSSLEEIKDPVEKKIQFFRRFYSTDFSEKQIVPIIDWLRNKMERKNSIEQRKQRFTAARKTALAISDYLVKTYHANKVVLVGSLLDERRFDIHSDIDLCVEGIPSDSYFRAVGESLLQASPFDVDLIPMEHAGERMNKHVMEGEVLYVKA